MKVFWDVDDVCENMVGGALAIGNFDGVHRGHQALIRRAKNLSSTAGVLTFLPHPVEILNPDVHPFYLSTIGQKLALFRRLLVDVVIVCNVDANFLSQGPKAFVENVVAKPLRISHAVVGDDFTFGYKAEGDTKLLAQLGAQFSISVDVVGEIKVDGQRVSSTNIRQSLIRGDVELAHRMLGRPYSLLSKVGSDQKLGGLLGFKTANQRPASGFALKTGVYASYTKINERYLLSVTNVGFRPTIDKDEHELRVETHFLDEDLIVYDENIEVFFVARLRDEEKFASLTALQAQVQRDCQAVRQMHLRQPSLFRPED